MILKQVNKSISMVIDRGGPKNLNYLGSKMRQSAKPTPSNGPISGFAQIKIIKSKW